MKICVTNNLGRPYIISYVPKSDKQGFVSSLILNRGINIIENDLFEKVKDHPLVKVYLEKKIFEVSTAIEGKEKPKEVKEESHKKEEKHK